ncbi:adenylate cyclase [Candidatus Epulonipiscium fishelsonii]|uniref:Adenylate cyclase n=1 Tax=Candidatus Epulonipiscium fishelsonii TaxID=77094 RepID=A0ACC8XHT8_9FIRM|nr:adenylate cyclase [Epulopiscium sp. SCG-D08WGA-EpuloA1]OON97848.1 MAG: adenylate cyclase [Epulopiscium sp. AS2M-Bin002]
MYSSIDTLWILIGAVLVFFMQAGFAMVESGFTRAKNAGNIIMKNLMDFAAGTLIFWVIGFGLMFGTSLNGLVGTPDFFVQGDYSGTYPTMAFLIFQTVFCATSATIVSGAMAERTKFSSYCIYSLILSGFIYPVSGHWIWGGGWLSQMGFHDFAGSTAVHMVGGVAALIGAKILGPRIGKYDKNGKPKAILGHSLTLGALGVFILWFCWFGFNGASSLSLTGDEAIITVSTIFVTTNISAAAASVVTMLITWVKYGKPDVSMTLNGALGGLVAITAGCNVVSPFGAFWIGTIAGFVIVFGIEFVDKILKIDDPVGAVGVHGMCGAVGTILVGVFSVSNGLAYGGGYEALKIQTIGVLAVATWVAITMTIVFKVIKLAIGLRVSKEEEIIGLDIEEHGLTTSYADFMPMDAKIATYPEQQMIPVKHSMDMPITKITIITKQSNFEDLKLAMKSIGVTGMTVTQVLGCGIQKGTNEYYRGIPVDFNLLPKVKIEIVVSKVPVDLVIKAATDCLNIDNIGDGKIFVYPVIDVIKVRTGEKGYSALQDE